MPQVILGISAYYHDSAAAILVDGKIIAAAQEERFTRKKYDPSFPKQAVKYVLEEAGLKGEKDLAAIAFYDKPLLKFERLLETYHAFAPAGLKSFLEAMPVWIKEKIFLKRRLYESLSPFGITQSPILFPEHHLSHAASAFFPSPFPEAAILTIDGVGEWATATIGSGAGNQIEILKSLHFPHSIGLLYSSFTYYTGFKVNSGEYKLMGLAPYGNPHSVQTKEFKNKILEELVDIREDGSILLNMDYFDFATGFTMTNDAAWEKLFGLPPRKESAPLTQCYMNMALAIQQITEEIVCKLAVTAKKLTQKKYLVLAGGVALNSVANGKLLAARIFDDLWIQPAAGDAGGAVGAALAVWHIWLGKERGLTNGKDAMDGAYLGPEFSDKEIAKVLNRYSAPHQYFSGFDDLAEETAKILGDGKVVGWFQGRMEYGPRALGNRSILGDARNPDMQKRMNLKIKFREGFRPFAPAVLEEDIGEYFQLDRPSPYMLLVVPVKEDRRRPLPPDDHEKELYERLYHLRSDIPAVTHVDYSARVQSVSKETNPRFWQLLSEFKKETGYGLLVNTSFNVRGEPIVGIPEEAFRCFMRTEIDYLVMGNYLLAKADQKPIPEEGSWQEKFQLD